MKIIILGAGQVGASVAHNLAAESSNDITVVDLEADKLYELQERLDIRTVTGGASHPETLRQAGAEDADMIIAVTGSDECNMVACQVAFTLFRTPTKIARVRSAEYLAEEKLFNNEATPIDVLISPEQIVTDYLVRLIETTGALQVLDFAGGRARLVGVKAFYGGPLVGHQLRTMRQHMPKIDARVAAIYRGDRAIIPHGDTVIEADDEIFFVAARENIRAVMSEFCRLEKPVKRVLIAGGGNIGTRLALALEPRCKVKLIETSQKRAMKLSETLDETIVLLGDAADRDLLVEENVEDMDVFCAVTNDDEANILSAMLAKRMGAKKVMSLINRPAYVELVESGIVDMAISPHQVTIGALLIHIRRGDVVAVHSLRRGAAEAIEAVAHGDQKTSKVVGRRIGDLPLPEGATIGALVRGEDVIIAHHDVTIEAEDHVILFLVDKAYIEHVERLFQVEVGFI